MQSIRLGIVRSVGLGVCAAAAMSAHANLLTNGGFELGPFTGGVNGNQSLAVGATAMTGWTVITDSISWLNGSAFGLAPFSGSQYLDLTDTNDTGLSGGVTQTIATVAGSSYLLTYWLGSSTLYTSENLIRATAGLTSATCAGPAPSSNATWSKCTMAFTAAGASTAISLAGAGGNGWQYLGLDDVSVDLTSNAVPEPGSQALVLLALAGVGTVTARRRRLP